MRRKAARHEAALAVGVAGGSGSGKTTLARLLACRLGGQCALLAQDLYYYDVEGDWFPPAVWNYDHPDALELDLMAEHVRRLKKGEAVEAPAYDFGLYRRTGGVTRVDPAPVLILEGTLVLAHPTLRELLDVRVFVDTPDDVRFIRRLQRDVVERGRDLDTVIQQYLTWNRPMHRRFVAPSREHAHIVVPNGGMGPRALDGVLGAVRGMRPHLAIQAESPRNGSGTAEPGQA